MMKTFKFLRLLTALSMMAAVSCKESNNDPDAPAPEPEPTPTVEADFKIEFKDVTSTGATIEVTPVDNSEYYAWDMMPKAEFDKKYKSDDDLVSEHMDYLYRMLAEYQATVDASGTLINILARGTESQRIKSLSAETEYIAFAFTVSPEGTPEKNVVKATVKTKAFAVTDKCTFNIAFSDVSQLAFSFNVTPSDNSTKYYIGLADGAVLSQQTPEEVASAFIKQAEVAEVDWANTDALRSGAVTLNTYSDMGISDLEPETEYSIVVFGVSPLGERTTEVFHKEVTTAKVPKSNMTFEINVVETTADGVKIDIIPSVKNETFMAGCVQKTDYDKFKKEDGSYDDNAFMEYLITNGNLTLFEGDTRLDRTGKLLTDRDYICFVFGYVGGVTTPLSVVEFRTAQPETSGEASVEITKVEVTSPSKLSSFADGDICMYMKPNDKAAHWYAGYFKSENGVVEDFSDAEIIAGLTDHATSTILWDAESISRAVAFGNEYTLFVIAADADGKLGKLVKKTIIPTADMVGK